MRLDQRGAGLATVAPRNFRHDGQAQAAAAGQVAGAPEALEHMGQVVAGQARAVVFDFQHGVLPSRVTRSVTVLPAPA